MVFQSDPAFAVADFEEEIVMIVVLRAEKFDRLSHKIAMKLNLLIGGGELLRVVRDDVETNVGRKVFDAHIRAGKNRAVHEDVQSGGFKMNDGSVLRGDLECRGYFPIR